jgi:hypothetical protein
LDLIAHQPLEGGLKLLKQFNRGYAPKWSLALAHTESFLGMSTLFDHLAKIIFRAVKSSLSSRYRWKEKQR